MAFITFILFNILIIIYIFIALFDLSDRVRKKKEEKYGKQQPKEEEKN